MKKKHKRTGLAIVAILFLLFATLLICDNIVSKNAIGRTYNSAEEIPYRKVALVLGTNPQTRKGNVNIYFKNRIDASAELYHKNKVSYLLLSGDNRKQDYNEPEAMRDSLIAKDVPEEAIILDYAGFRTLDSVVRAKEVFGQDSITIVSQLFHNERAIYIADQRGINAIALNAMDAKTWEYPIRRILREWISRMKLFIDEWTGKQPHFLGEVG